MTEEMNPWEGFVFLFAPGIILLFSLIWLMFDWPAILRELCTKRLAKSSAKSACVSIIADNLSVKIKVTVTTQN